MSVGMLLMNFYWAWGCYRGILMHVGMLPIGYILQEFALTQTLCILITIYTSERQQDNLQPWMSVDLELMLLI